MSEIVLTECERAMVFHGRENNDRFLCVKNELICHFDFPFELVFKLRNVPLNEGILYRRQIEEQLKSLVDVEDMKITFENTK